MKLPAILFDKAWKINLMLLICSASIYTFYFYDVFMNINSILSSNEGDAIKNYYTYCYHIKNDSSFLHFSGMNFPFGEHIVFTDCQPIITFILRSLPISHPYSVGILHSLIFISFILTPLLLYKILSLQKVDRFSSFFISLAITLLSPQYYKLLAGHHALAYTFIIPLCILMLLRFFKNGTRLNLFLIFIYNFALFFLHPYFGLGTSLFSLISLITYDLISNRKNNLLKHLLKSSLAGILPIVLFKLFMFITDKHAERTIEPQNIDALNAGLGSLVHSGFGPFAEELPKVFSIPASSFEGNSYIGVFLILVVLVSVIILFFLRKNVQWHKGILSVFIASLALLILAFGVHNTLLSALNIKIAALNQFRACGRFIWYFYYSLPLFLLPLIYHASKNKFSTRVSVPILKSISVLYFFFNLWEANSLFILDRGAFWKYKNTFNVSCLSKSELLLLDSLKTTPLQAIIPLPLYHSGSEVYDRPESGFMNYSMLYSYHLNLPIVSSFLSRTAIHETEEVIQTLNCYKRDHAINKILNGTNFLTLKSMIPLQPDEERLYSKCHIVRKDSFFEFAYLKQTDLFKKVLDEKKLFLCDTIKENSDLIYLIKKERKPFLVSNIKDYETIYSLDSNQINSGDYVLSFRYYYNEKTHPAIDCHFIVNEVSPIKEGWTVYTPINRFSGFYEGYAIFERKIKIDQKTHYDFMLSGHSEKQYKISHFLIRQASTSVVLISGKDSIFNNFAH